MALESPKTKPRGFIGLEATCYMLLDQISYPLRAHFESKGTLSHPDKPMRFAFFKRLSIYAVGAFLVSLIVSFVFETKSCLREVQRKIETTFIEAYESSENAKSTYNTLQNVAIEGELIGARALAKILEVDQGLLERAKDESSTELEDLARLLGLGEICIADENGIVVASYPKILVGFDYKTSYKAKEFLKILDDPELEIVQPIRKSEGRNADNFQYTGVARHDAPGFVEVGYDADELKKWYDLADASLYVSNKLGADGFLSVMKGNSQIIGHVLPDMEDKPIGKPFMTFVEDQPYFVYARQLGSLLFIGGIPHREVFYERSLRLFALVVCTFFIFFTLFLLISYLVQRLFVKSVVDVNNSLYKIAQGDLNEHVNVDNTKEFAELSSGVNATVDSLKSAAQKVVQKNQEEMALAGRIQKQSLPNLVELFNERSDFEVRAQNISKTEVGGDLYDCFLTGSDDLWFYVADVAGNGVPAALVMMKTITLIKNLALSGKDLAQTITLTNRYLSERDSVTLVSGFFCRLNLKTGTIQTINAGYVNPVLRRLNGEATYFKSERQVILGASSEQVYFCSNSKLAAGDEILLFSDGFRNCDLCSGQIPECDESLLKKFDTIPPGLPISDALQRAFSVLTGKRPSAYDAALQDDETIMIFRFLNRTDS